MFSIGIDLGGTKIAAGVVDDRGVLIAKESTPTLPKRHYTAIFEDAAAVAKKACASAGVSFSDAAGVGLGSPGTVDSKDGVIVYACNINFDHAPVREELSKHFGLPIFISNDANCAALGETSENGAARGLKNVSLVTLGTGVGGGLLVDGKIYEGDHSAGAEIGHMVLVVDGEPCTCGRNGCWESYSSLRALVRMTEKAIRENPDTLMREAFNRHEKISAKTAFEASRRGDRAACQVVETYVKFLSEGILNLVNVFRPEVVIIGGGISNEGEYLLEPVRAYVGKYAYGGARTPVPPIRRSLLGNDAGIIGAAMLAFCV